MGRLACRCLVMMATVRMQHNISSDLAMPLPHRCLVHNCPRSSVQRHATKVRCPSKLLELLKLHKTRNVNHVSQESLTRPLPSRSITITAWPYRSARPGATRRRCKSRGFWIQEGGMRRGRGEEGARVIRTPVMCRICEAHVP